MLFLFDNELVIELGGTSTQKTNVLHKAFRIDIFIIGLIFSLKMVWLLDHNVTFVHRLLAFYIFNFNLSFLQFQRTFWVRTFGFYNLDRFHNCVPF